MQVQALKSLASVFEIDFSTLTSELDMTTLSPSPQDEQLALAQVRQEKSFYIHLMQYLFVFAALAVVNWWVNPAKLWVQWVALGWGIGVLAHAARVFEWMPFFGAEWEKKRVEKRLGRPL